VHTQPVGVRPTIELEPTEIARADDRARRLHKRIDGRTPLAIEQELGMTVDRVREIAERLLHPE
jgi:hypothetical protein